MSTEMAIGDNATQEHKLISEDTEIKAMDTESVLETAVETPAPGDATNNIDADELDKLDNIENSEDRSQPDKESIEEEPEFEEEESKEEESSVEQLNLSEEEVRGIKRRASAAFSDDDIEFKGFEINEKSDLPDFTRILEEDRRVKRRTSMSSDDGFKGFDLVECNNLTGYSQVLERLELEVAAEVKSFTPVRTVTASPAVKANKRARQDTGGCTKWSEHLEAEVSAFVRSFSDEDVKPARRQRQPTDGSRPSSALSFRSDGEGAVSTDASSPAGAGAGAGAGGAGRGRRAAADLCGPQLRVPLERGWRRELVYRAAAADAAKRNADIYYYTPHGKKLRSTREVAEQLTGTGLTLENFSFFKEPLGIDDPEKEIIRDAKVMRRVESPVPPAAPPTVIDGKRTPKPKPPKGASPEPVTPKLLPAKIKVKSMGSRLSTNGTSTPKPVKKPQTQAPAPPPADNNNSASWKKPKGQPAPRAHPQPLQVPQPIQGPQAPQQSAHPPRPHALATLERDQGALQHQMQQQRQQQQQQQQPCSMSCGRGAVPSLACAACLCLYHPACVSHTHAPEDKFLCKNCKPTNSPPHLDTPLMHKSGTGITQGMPIPPANIGNQGARRQANPVPVPAPAKVPKPDNRVLLRMKVAEGGDGRRVWEVAGGAGPARTQALARLNGRRFIVVSRPEQRAVNGASPPLAAAAASPRRRGRPRLDDTDHFTAFCNKADPNAALHIFQYLGMRDLARAARVCQLWQRLAAAPALWRHVRMKNSHVSDWAGLCAALKRHGTRWLDLRKMLLPANDGPFWDHFIEHIGSLDQLERLELCRCPARVVEAACERLPALRALAAPAVRDGRLDPAPFARLPRLEQLRLKSLAGLSLARDLAPLAGLQRLQHLSLTSIKELGLCACEVVGQLENLESLELGECSFGASFANALAGLSKLRRLRLERGVSQCATPQLLRALSALPRLTRLELVNFDVTVGFDDALADCKNIQRLLIIPTYVSQSATTNKQVLSGVLRLKETLTHLMWGVTIELLRVTELFIDQCEAGEGEGKRRDVGECIPVLKPVPGCRLPDDHRTVAGPPQVEILPISTLQRLLSAQLPNTKLKLLRIPFHATWRQSLADFQ